MLHHNANAQSTLDAPRFCISADVPTDEKEGHIGTKVYLEDGVRPDVVEGLKKLGHDVELLTGHDRGMFGKGQVCFRLFFLTLFSTLTSSSYFRRSSKNSPAAPGLVDPTRGETATPFLRSRRAVVLVLRCYLLVTFVLFRRHSFVQGQSVCRSFRLSALRESAHGKDSSAYVEK
jgi:hypothetical protein